MPKPPRAAEPEPRSWEPRALPPGWLPTPARAVYSALVYGVLGVIWMFGVSWLAHHVAPQAWRMWFDVAVDWVFVGGSALVLGLALNRYFRTIRLSAQQLQQNEQLQALTAEVLGILNEPQALPDATRRLLAAIKRATGFDAVGMRLQQGQDFPYCSAEGFSEAFLEAENHLVARTERGDVCRDAQGKPCLECTCGLVLSGQANSAHPGTSPAGSIWTNDGKAVLRVPAEQDPRRQPRNHCVHTGYQSVALIPIRVDQEIVGLLQLNDRRKNCFTPDTLRFFEGLAASFGVALRRHRGEEQLRGAMDEQRQKAALLEALVGSSPDGITVVDEHGGIILQNPQCHKLLRLPAELAAQPGDAEQLQCVAEATTAPADFRHKLRQIQAQPEAIHRDEIEFKDGRTLERCTAPVRGQDQTCYGQVRVYRDITQRKAHEREIERLNRLYATLSQVNQAIVRAQTRDDLLQAMCQVAVQFGGFEYAWIGWRLPDGAGLQRVAQAAGPRTTGELPPGTTVGCELSVQALSTGGAAFSNGTMDDTRTRICHAAAGSLGLRSCATIPFRFQGQVQGVLGICSRDLGFFNAEEIRLLEEVALDISYGLDQLSEQEQRRQAEARLRQHQALLKEMERIAQVGGWEFEVATGRGQWTDEVARIHDLEPEVPTCVEMGLSYYTPASRPRIEQAVREAIEQGRPYDLELELISAKGVRKWVRTGGRPVVEDGKVVRVFGSLQDITWHKQAEAGLRESEERYRSLFRSNHAAMLILDPRTGRIVDANPAAARFYGWTEDQLRQKRIQEINTLAPEQVTARLERAQTVAEQHFFFTHRLADGSTRNVEVYSSYLSLQGAGLLYSIILDVTERQQAEAALRASLEEKTALLKEVHHRVKNNLQVVDSLLSLQARRVQNPAVLPALRDTQSRIRSMALLHETLYREGNVARVNCQVYLGHLCAHLQHAFSPQTGRVRLEQRIAAVQLELDKAIPCGLIVNELVSNAFKHAFPGDRSGGITVELGPDAEGRLGLVVADDGVGLPAGEGTARAGSMGLELVRGLARQIDASLEVQGQAGTRVQVRFPAQTIY